MNNRERVRQQNRYTWRSVGSIELLIVFLLALYSFYGSDYQISTLKGLAYLVWCFIKWMLYLITGLVIIDIPSHLYLSFRLTGVPPLRTCYDMLKINRETKDKHLGPLWLFPPVTIILLFTYIFVDSNEYLLPFISVSLSLHVYQIVNAALPPTVLFLSTSDEDRTYLLTAIQFDLRPLSMVSLLEPRFDRELALSGVSAVGYGMRMADGVSWESVVLRLVDLTPIVVLDTRNATPHVIQEIHWLLSPDRIHKTWFIVEANPGHSELDNDTPEAVVRNNPKAKCINEEQLLETLKKLTQSRHTMPKPPAVRIEC